MYSFHWEVISEYLPTFGSAILTTIYLSLLGELVGIVAGLLIALLRLSPVAPVRWLAGVYIDFFRGVPLLVVLIWIYFAFPVIFNLNPSPLQASVVGLGLTYAAYLAEVFRAGIQAIPRGQREAAFTLGFTELQTLRAVILPQALRVVIPPLGNSFVGMLKDSSLVSVIGQVDLMRQGQIVTSQTFRPLEVYTFVALVYYAMTLMAARAINYTERRFAIVKAPPRGRPFWRGLARARARGITRPT